MSHYPRLVMLLLVFTTPFLRADAQTKPAPTAPTNRLIGRWELLSIGGMAIPKDLALFWVIDAGHVTVTDKDGGHVSSNPYSLEINKSPKTIVIKMQGELDRVGWFEIKDDELRLLLTVQTGKPPRSWEDGGVMILKLSPAIAI